MSTTFTIEQSRENGRTIESWPAQPVYGPAPGNQSYGAAVAHDAIVLNAVTIRDARARLGLSKLVCAQWTLKRRVEFAVDGKASVFVARHARRPPFAQFVFALNQFALC